MVEPHNGATGGEVRRSPERLDRLNRTFGEPDQWWTSLAFDVPDLTCPGCGAELVEDELFLSYHLCGSCHRHFSLPARERLALLVDAGSFRETNAELASIDPVLFNDQVPAPDRIAEQRERHVIGDAVVTGTGQIGGRDALLIVLDDHLAGSTLGAIAAEKIILALELALSRRLPVVAVCAGGAARAQTGPLAVVQGGRLAAIASQLQLAGVPMIAVLTHPTAGGVFAALASQCDLIFAEPNAHVGVGLFGGAPSGLDAHPLTAESMREHGWIDGIVDRVALRRHLATLLDHLADRGLARAAGTAAGDEHHTVAAWEARAQAMHPDRPAGRFYVDRLISPFMEVCGDRVGADSCRVVCGIGRLDGLTVAVIAQNRDADGSGDDAAAIRKITRMVRLAGRFELPLVVLVDAPVTVDATAGTPEISLAVAKLASMLALLPVPVVSVAIGEIGGIVAMTLMSGDRKLMQTHAVYTLAGDGTPAVGAWPMAGGHGRGGLGDAPVLITAHEAQRLGLIDDVIGEPVPAAHADPEWAAAAIRTGVQHALSTLGGTGQRRLLDARQRRQRLLGQSTPEGLAAARIELGELQEWQRSLSRSLDDWRERWEQRRAGQSFRSFQRPDMSELANRVRARRTELLERAGFGDRPSD